MGDDADGEERSEHMSRVFALLTAKLEDAATLAADCQGRRTTAELRRGAKQIAELASETATIAAALSALLSPDENEAPA